MTECNLIDEMKRMKFAQFSELRCLFYRVRLLLSLFATIAFSIPEETQ